MHRNFLRKLLIISEEPWMKRGHFNNFIKKFLFKKSFTKTLKEETEEDQWLISGCGEPIR